MKMELRIPSPGGVFTKWRRFEALAGSKEIAVLDDVLFFASVATFSAAAILGYWQLLRAETEGLEEPVAMPADPELLPEPVPAAI